MKTIGLIGGMSFESSLEYYRIINEEVRKELGSNNSAKIVMHSLNFQEIEDLQFKGDEGWHALNNLMLETAKKLEDGGADCIAICTNLMHRTAPIIEAWAELPLIHIVDATARKTLDLGLKKVGLLGAIFTMKNDFYKKPLSEKYGLDVITPNEADMQEVSRIIYEELCQGEFLPKSKTFLKEVVQKLEQEGAKGVILGCTELPLILQEDDANIYLLDTMKIHVDTLVAFALKEGA